MDGSDSSAGLEQTICKGFELGVVFLACGLDVEERASDVGRGKLFDLVLIGSCCRCLAFLLIEVDEFVDSLAKN